MKKGKVFLAIILAMFLLAIMFGCTEATKLSFATDSITVVLGKEITPEVKIYPKKFDYTLSVVNESLAKITDDKTVKGLVEGITTLVAESGKLRAECTLYVVGDYQYDNTDPIVVDKYTVYFKISNYAEYGLSTGTLDPYIALSGTTIDMNEPVVYGYYVDCWYTDSACTQKFDMDTKIYRDTTLYAKISPREISYNVVNKLIVGLLYKNLPHEKLILPECTEGGGEIIGIADEAFFADETITEVTIPDNYVVIGTSAFAGCKNLEKVIIGENSRLEHIGNNAFGVVVDNNKITAYNEKLTQIYLPDTVTEVGASAFYMCKNLVLDNIPSAITQVKTYSFAETLLKKANLSSVTIIEEGAFNNCTELESVSGTENVRKCGKYAFSGTQIEANERERYSKDLADPGYYAGTILFGVYKDYGMLVGNGKYRIREDTTLIADNAFANSAQKELTLYADTAIATSSADKYDFFGDNVFYKNSDGYPEGIFVVVDKNILEKFCERYVYENGDYAELFCQEEIVEIRGENNSDQINWGKHTLLYRSKKYYYDKYVPFAEGNARVIKVGDLPTKYGYTIRRINMNAFTAINPSGEKNGLEQLFLNGVISIAYKGVANCTALQYVYLTGNNINITMPESTASLTFNGKIVVDDNSFTTYRSKWNGFNDLLKKLVKVSEI